MAISKWKSEIPFSNTLRCWNMVGKPGFICEDQFNTSRILFVTCWFLNWTFKIVYRTKFFHSLITHCNIEVTHGYDVVINFAILTKGPFKNDITGVGGGRYPKLVTKSDIGGRGVHAISDITTKKNSLEVFIFHLFLASAAAAELWLAFRWWCCFKHWPESQHSGEIKLDLHLVKCVCLI